MKGKNREGPGHKVLRCPDFQLQCSELATASWAGHGPSPGAEPLSHQPESTGPGPRLPPVAQRGALAPGLWPGLGLRVQNLPLLTSLPFLLGPQPSTSDIMYAESWPPGCPILTPRTCEDSLIWLKRLSRHDLAEDLKMRKFSWSSPVSPASSQVSL